jgi:hypothetical protein
MKGEAGCLKRKVLIADRSRSTPGPCLEEVNHLVSRARRHLAHVGSLRFSSFPALPLISGRKLLQSESEYFQREDRRGITRSIQTQGTSFNLVPVPLCQARNDSDGRALAYTEHFLRPISVNDVLFGDTFDRPLKLPWGSGATLKFMEYVSYPTPAFHGSRADMFLMPLFLLYLSFVDPTWNLTLLQAQSRGHV